MTTPRFIRLTLWDHNKKAPGKSVWINPEKIFSIFPWIKVWHTRNEAGTDTKTETVELTTIYCAGGFGGDEPLGEAVIETPEEILLAIGLPYGLHDITDEILGYCLQAPSGDIKAILALATTNRLYAGPTA